MSVEQNIALLQRVIDEVWNGGDLDLADQLFASFYVNRGGLIPDLLMGPEMIKLGVALYHTAFPGLHITIEGLQADRDHVVFQWTARSGSALAHEPGMVDGTTCCRMADGQIAESWTIWNSGVAWQESGALAPQRRPRM